MGSCYITQGTQPSALWGPREVGLEGGRDVQEEGEIYGWCVILYSRNQHNIVNQLSSSQKKKKIKRQWPEFGIKFDNVLGKQKEDLKVRQTHVVKRVPEKHLFLLYWLH